MKWRNIIYILASALLVSCFSNNSEAKSSQKIEKQEAKKNISINFCADSAYSYIATQCSFGPRTLESKAHDKCVEFMVGKLKEFGGDVEIQRCEVVDWMNKTRKAENVIAHFGDSTKLRIVLFSHYDSRPYADKDKDDAMRYKAIDGANDGASGVGVILEIARQFYIDTTLKSKYALDVVFLDAEDLGEPSFITGNSRTETWCLGSQYWSANYKYSKYEKPVAGILLDMVGDKEAVFGIDYTSELYANDVAEKVWRKAAQLGYGNYFRRDNSGAELIDDHYFINPISKIPTIDIIDFCGVRGGFPATWHTHNDVVENISKKTLEAVGKTIILFLTD